METRRSQEDVTFVTFVLHHERQVWKNCSKEYECKMYNATSRNPSKVWQNQSHLIPWWTQKSSILENLYTNLSNAVENSILLPSFSMCQDMRLEVRWLCKPFITGVERTNVWSVTSVNANMGAKVKIQRKSLATAFKCTLEWFFTSMNKLMSL